MNGLFLSLSIFGCSFEVMEMIIFFDDDFLEEFYFLLSFSVLYLDEFILLSVFGQQVVELEVFSFLLG